MPPAALAADDSVSLTNWNKQVLFSWQTEKCAKTDIPDAPPRAFRNFRGQLHLWATHKDNRDTVGPDFDHLKHQCKVAFIGQNNDDPKAYNDQQWISAFATDDGKTIYALIHNEFHGDQRPALCPSKIYLHCWENALTMAVSTDGGATFNEAAAPKNIVAAIPYVYQGDIGRPIGYFQPANIVRMGGLYYILFNAQPFNDQKLGTCVARTATLGDSASWRGWDGQGYNVVFVDPYLAPVKDPAAHVCAPVGVGSLFSFGSVTYDSTSRLFVGVTSIVHGSGNAALPPGVYAAMSTDLVTWSKPSPVVSEAELVAHDPNKHETYGDFSIIDEASASRDYSTISASPRLFLYYTELSQIDPPYDRQLVKLPITLQRTP